MREWLRPLLAAMLAFTIPGLGHVLLRRWGRALVWHGTIVGGTIALYVLYDVEPVAPLAEPTAFVATMPAEVSISVAFLVTLSAIDAYLVGREDATAAIQREAAAVAAEQRDDATGNQGGAADGESGVTGMVERTGTADAARTERPQAGSEQADPPEVECPNCGRTTDAEIDFCHWCTEPLPWATDGE